MIRLQAQVIVAGRSASVLRGRVLYSQEPLSFWGGYDYHSGEIIDRRHPLSGQIAAGRILCLPFTRGSSTTTAVLLEAVKAGTSPVALVTTGIDSFFALASIVADELYGLPIPLLSLPAAEFAALQGAGLVEIGVDGVLYSVGEGSQASTS